MANTKIFLVFMFLSMVFFVDLVPVGIGNVE
jgi:hypothetical protein